MDYSVAYLPERSRYEMTQGDRLLGFAEVRFSGGDAIFAYVEICPEERGKGYGNILIREAIEDVRGKGHRPIGVCPFVDAYLRRNPE